MRNSECDDEVTVRAVDAQEALEFAFDKFGWATPEGVTVQRACPVTGKWLPDPDATPRDRPRAWYLVTDELRPGQVWIGRAHDRDRAAELARARFCWAHTRNCAVKQWAGGRWVWPD